MRYKNLLSSILLTLSLVTMVLVGIGLFLWLDAVKETEARQLYGNLDNGAGRIQSEIALEFAVITALFTYTDEIFKDSESEAFFPALMKLVPALHRKWLYGTRFPDLIDDIFLVNRTDADPLISRYSDAEKRFIPDSGAAPDLIRDLSIRDNESGSYRIVSYPDGLALVIPIERYLRKELKDKSRKPVYMGYILILLDREYFAEEIVADLFVMYLGSGGGRYSFAVVADENDDLLFSSSNLTLQKFHAIVSRHIDRIVPLTAWISTENSLLSDVLSAADEESSALPQGILSARIKDLFIRQWFGLTKARSQEFASGKPAPAAAHPSGGVDHSGGINLYIWHSAGSIEEAVRSVRNRRLAAGYSALVCFALVAIVFYLLYRRARNLRDREHEFVATVTHELRTPVTAINIAADNLTEGIVRDPVRVREYGRAILEHGRRLGDLIGQVLLYAGLSGVTKRTRSEPVQLDEFVRSVASRISSMPQDRLVIHVQPDLPLYSGDPVAVETVIINLISNTAKHSGNTATVTLNVYREALRTRSWLVIRVSDTGRGIPKRELGRILEPFYRGEASRVNQIPGSGLGLSLVNRVIRTYRGRLSIDSTVGRGTIVTVRLPFEQDRSDEG
jgi:signal transduction histidine kinase